MYIIFSFTNIFEFLIEFNWIELRVIIIGIYILKRKKISLYMMILCHDPFIIIYKRYFLFLKKQLKKITGHRRSIIIVNSNFYIVKIFYNRMSYILA